MLQRLLLLMLLLIPNLAAADAWDEFCEWRRRVGLPQVQKDPAMMKFAQDKANYRAYYGLQNGHQGPKQPYSWREGTGEATATWGFLTCCMEEDATHGGAGLCIGKDGQRYMVLVLRGGSGQALISRHQIPVHNTSYLTPKPLSYRTR